MTRIWALIAALALLAPDAFADERLAAARLDFETLCAPCHGSNGKGDHPTPVGLTKKPADLTAITAKYGGVFPEERVFATIAGLDSLDSHGSRDMPIWGDVFVSENVGNSVRLEDAMKASDEASRRIAGLMDYIRSLQVQP